METTNCKRCKQDVPKGSFILHEIHCARFLQACPKCQDCFPSSELKKHDEKVHMLINCQICSSQIKKGSLDDHKMNNCSGRVIACQFCEMECLKSNLEEHEVACGSRTECCTHCDNFILVRMFKAHMELHENRTIQSSQKVAESLSTAHTNLIDETPSSKNPPTDVGSDVPQAKTKGVEVNLNNEASQKPEGVKYRNVVCKQIFSRIHESQKSPNNYSHYGEGASPTANKRSEMRSDDPFQVMDYFHASESIALPCEFCQGMYSAENLAEHQILCGTKIQVCPWCHENVTGFQKLSHVCLPSNYTAANVAYDEDLNRDAADGGDGDSMQSNEASIPCEYCRTLFPFSCIELHEISCKFLQDNEALPMASEAPTTTKTKESRAHIPCFNCKTVVPAEIMELHQSRCIRRYGPQPVKKVTQPVMNSRNETGQEKALRLSVLQATESRKTTNAMIRQSAMKVVTLKDGSQILKKRENDAANGVDVGNVLGRGPRFERETDHSSPSFNDHNSSHEPVKVTKKLSASFINYALQPDAGYYPERQSNTKGGNYYPAKRMPSNLTDAAADSDPYHQDRYSDGDPESLGAKPKRWVNRRKPAGDL